MATKEYHQQWRKENNEKAREISRRHYHKDIEKSRAKSRKWYAENREKCLASCKKWLSKNKEHRRLYEIERRKANPEYFKKKYNLYHERYRDARNEKKREWGLKLKLDVIQGYGGKCVCCGETHYEFLSIDHINGNGQQDRKKGGSQVMYRRLKKLRFPKDEYRLLCMNCNFALGKYGYCPHGELDNVNS